MLGMLRDMVGRMAGLSVGGNVADIVPRNGLRFHLPEILQVPPKLLPFITEFNAYRYFLAEGGRGSGKSQTVGRLLLYIGEQKKVRIVCGREIQANIEESVYTLLKDLITQNDLAYDVLAHEIRHKYNGTTIKFKGFREQGSVSVKGLEGVDILWIDEAQSITKTTLDIIMPTIRKEKSKIFFTMNRHLRDDAVCEEMVGNPECLHVQINYFENPYCPLNLKIQAENCKRRSERDYKHIWLGHPLSAADEFLFNYDQLHASIGREPFGETFFRQRVLGIDFAAQGNDQCVATLLDRLSNQHWGLTERVPWDEENTMHSVGKIVNMIGDFKPNIAIIDIGGMGKPVYDRLVEVLGSNTKCPIFPFDGGSTEGVDTNHYGNKRSSGYHLLDDWFDSAFLCVTEKDREVIKQLEKIKRVYKSNGVRFIEDKKTMKKLMKYSPDDADSLMMAVWGAVHCLGKSANSDSQSSGQIKRISGSRRGRK